MSKKNYLIPVLLKDRNTLLSVIEEMKMAGRRDPKVEAPKASNTVFQAFVNAEREDVVEAVRTSGHTRCLGVLTQFGIVPIAVSLTLDHYTTPHRWNLSVSIVNPFGEPCRVPDTLCDNLVKDFLGDNYTEIPAIGAFKDVRQFIAETEE